MLEVGDVDDADIGELVLELGVELRLELRLVIDEAVEVAGVELEDLLVEADMDALED